MKILDQYNINALSKKLYKTDIMPSGNSRSFIKLSEKLILSLQSGHDSGKMKRIISSELITNYGLSLNEKEVTEIAETVDSWYNE